MCFNMWFPFQFGQNKKLNLEYEFEDPALKKQEDAKTTNASESECPPEELQIDGRPKAVRGNVNCDTNRAAAVETSCLPGAGMSAMLSMDKERRTDVVGRDSAEARENSEEKYKVDLGEAKRAAVENLSGMLVQLLSMARVIMAKAPTESCPCGHVCGRAGGGFRSPAATKGQGLLGIGRSPGSGRSPRNGRITSGGGQSPNVRSPGVQQVIAGRSPLAAKTLKERSKPSSAKKLIPDVLESGHSMVREN